MISAEQMVELADFTLSYLSSNREYKLVLVRKKTFLELKKELQEQGIEWTGQFITEFKCSNISSCSPDDFCVYLES
jgi:hypothetical protein